MFAPEALAFKPERMSPASKLKQMFSLTGLSGILKSLLPFAVILWIGVSTVTGEWQRVVHASDLACASVCQFSLWAHVASCAGSQVWCCWRGRRWTTCWSGKSLKAT